MAKPTHVVVHKRLYMAVKGKMQHFPQGTQLALSAQQAEKMKGRVEPIGQGEVLEPSGVADELEELRARAIELGIDNAGKKAEKTLRAEIKKVEDEIEAANAATAG